KPFKGRPGASLPPADFTAATTHVAKLLERDPLPREVVSHLLYPRVYEEFIQHQKAYSDVAVLPTNSFLYGHEPGDEVAVEIESGKTLIIKFLTVSDPHPDGERTVFFELNGQPRDVNVLDRSRKPREAARLKADPADPLQVAAPMPGLVVNVAVQSGDRVTKGQKLLTMEAMKMETTLYAEFDAKVTELLARPGTQVQTGDLVLRLERLSS
ncbi:MAG: biotin/lipoyl-containing protein, partial [Planctomycetaceae bacterium]